MEMIENKRNEFWKIPPRVKVYEALGCIADNHVEFKSENEAIVTSSEGNRKYSVVFNLNKNFIKSDDNGSKWKGYLGYPSIAVLMLKGVLPFNKKISDALKEIKWYRLNKMFNNYEKTIEEAEKIAEQRGCSRKEIREFVDKVMEEIKKKKFRKEIQKERQEVLLSLQS
jgi:hypothetical protein